VDDWLKPDLSNGPNKGKSIALKLPNGEKSALTVSLDRFLGSRETRTWEKDGTGKVSSMVTQHNSIGGKVLLSLPRLSYILHAQ